MVVDEDRLVGKVHLEAALLLADSCERLSGGLFSLPTLSDFREGPDKKSPCKKIESEIKESIYTSWLEELIEESIF